jgi:hypothetical protein
VSLLFDFRLKLKAIGVQFHFVEMTHEFFKIGKEIGNSVDLQRILVLPQLVT